MTSIHQRIALQGQIWQFASPKAKIHRPRADMNEITSKIKNQEVEA